MIDQINLYNNFYNGIKKLEDIYKTGFDINRVKANFCRSNVLLTGKQKYSEYLELVSLETIILTTLIGLNREKLERANSNTDSRSLFQYKDYESSMKIYYDDKYYKEGYEFIKEFSKSLNFNSTGSGCFPYMLEIITDNNKNRPYDYVSKIRNAMLHAEYYLESPEILHITNRDDNGNIIFEGRLLLFSFEMFVKDFFGTIGVSSSFTYYKQLDLEYFESEKDLIEYLCDFTSYKINFSKVPDSYKFSGKDALYSRLNGCFNLASHEKKSIDDELNELKKEGFEFDVVENKLNKEQIENVVKYIYSRYRNVLNNKEMVSYLASLLKLVINPIGEITNCLENMLAYISLKKSVLCTGQMTNIGLLEELEYDKYCDNAFLCTLVLLKANIMNYAIECSELEEIDFSMFNTSDIDVDNVLELKRRKNDLLLNGFSDGYANNKIIIETLRNALAHGGERLEMFLNNGLNMKLTDIYPNVPNLSVSFNIKKIDDLFKSTVLLPLNVRTKSGKKLSKS